MRSTFGELVAALYEESSKVSSSKGEQLVLTYVALQDLLGKKPLKGNRHHHRFDRKNASPSLMARAH
jgi:hypothetical protein